MIALAGENNKHKETLKRLDFDNDHAEELTLLKNRVKYHRVSGDFRLIFADAI